MIDIQFTVHTVDRKSDTVRDYISIRYDRYLDYSKYKCSLQNLDELAVDLLNEVLLNVLQRDEEFLFKLYCKKKVHKGKEYTELDWLILKAISLNSTSYTAPFRWKNKPIPTNADVKLERLKVIDEEYFEVDRPAKVIKQMRLIRWVFNGLNLTVFERYTFEAHFFQGDSFGEMDWHGDEKLKWRLYQDVLTVIQNILYYLNLTQHKSEKEMTNRQNKICTEFIRTHKINTKQSEYSNN